MDTPLHFIQPVFSFFLVSKVSIAKVSSNRKHKFCLGHVESTDKFIKDIFHFYYSIFFLISITSFWYFLRISTSLLIFIIWFCMPSTLSIIALGISIIVVLNSWCYDLNIPIMSGSDAGSVSSNCHVLPFSVPRNFFLIVRHDILGKGKCYK